MNEYPLGQMFGLKLTARLAALVGSLVLWAVLSGVAVGLLNLPPGEAIRNVDG